MTASTDNHLPASQNQQSAGSKGISERGGGSSIDWWRLASVTGSLTFSALIWWFAVIPLGKLTYGVILILASFSP